MGLRLRFIWRHAGEKINQAGASGSATCLCLPNLEFIKSSMDLGRYGKEARLGQVARKKADPLAVVSYYICMYICIVDGFKGECFEMKDKQKCLLALARFFRGW